MGIFPKPQKPPPPPPTPKLADTAGAEPEDAVKGYQSLISTTPTGLKRKGTTAKRTLIGGSVTP